MIPLAAIARALHCSPGEISVREGTSSSSHSSGCLSTPKGPVFCKWESHPRPLQFSVEQQGLHALASAESGLYIPKVLAAEDDIEGSGFILLEYLPPQRPAHDFDEQFGRGLAALHRHSSTQGFGFAQDGYCGRSSQPNNWQCDWASFYAEKRLLHQAVLGRDRGLDIDIVRSVESLALSLPERLGDTEPPALIHGDLWAGNLLVAPDGRPALIDPAAYFGNREAELGMMRLFGGFNERVFEAYDEAFPLQPGWRERLPIYSLYHVLNHFTLFGGSYEEQARQILRQLL